MLIETEHTDRVDDMTNDKQAVIPESVMEKKIGNTTFIITSRFNGDKSRDITSALIRMVGRDMSISRNDTLKKAI